MDSDWMNTFGKDIVAAQTFRNSTMAAIFLVSAALALMMTVITLSGQSDKLDAGGHQDLWLMKLPRMLLDLFVAFFKFSLSVGIIEGKIGLRENRKARFMPGRTISFGRVY